MSNSFKLYFLGLLLLVGIAVAWAVTAQATISNIDSDSIDNRITQLERIFNVHSQLITKLQQQLIDDQRDIDLLRGYIQENQYQVSQLINRQKQIYQQIEKLFNKESSTLKLSHFRTPTFTDIGSQRGTLSVNAISTNNRDASTEYNKSIALVLEKKQYDQAISAFRNFIILYPNSIYQPNAKYWLGQLNYNQGKKDDALYYFALVAKTYQKSPKAPDALLKIGIIMQEKGYKNKAGEIYHQVGKLYPSTEAAKRAQKRLTTL